MAKIHFIWWGPFRDADTCAATPNAVATACSHHEVRYWVRYEHAAEFRKHLLPSIKVSGLRSFRELARSSSAILDESYFQSALDVLSRLDRHKAFAAVKDLMSLAILYQEGGLYLDTTNRLATLQEISDFRCGSLRDGLRALEEAGLPRFPFLQEDWLHQPLLHTAWALLTGSDPEHREAQVSVPALDVWAMYAPPRHVALRAMLESYASRCQRLGINRAATPESLDEMFRKDPQLAPRALRAENRHERLTRNEILGALIVRSVFDGITTNFGAEEMHALGIPARRRIVNHLTSYVVPALGLVKVYQNSWR